MATLVDSSALVALLSERDENHEAAKAAFADFGPGRGLLTHNYVVVETTAVTERRLGREAVRDLHTRLLRPLEVLWVDEETHALALSGLLAAGRISFVDWVSFQLMSRLGIETAFTFDRHFRAQGFEVVP